MRLDFETLSKLAHEQGPAFYLIDGDRFRANLHELVGAFRALYPRTALGYSYKTNYTPHLCRIADAEGCYAEVVSRLEYDLARRLGVDPARIVFNGPAKERADVEEPLLEGAVVNVDSADEVDAVEAVCRAHPDVPVRVGVRCHFALHAGHVTRFGVSAETGELAEVLARLRALESCRLHGLHCHFSALRTAGAFRARAERLVALVRTHFPDGPPPSLDLGGGFFGRMPHSLRAQFDAEVPSYEEYARAVAPVLAEAFPGPEQPELVLEPGAGVVAEAVSFVCRVVSTKHLPDRRVAVATGSIQNVRATTSALNLPMRVIPAPTRAGAPALPGPLDVTGYTCMEVDVLQRGFPGSLRTGDFLVFDNVGAYSTVFKPPFIRAAPAMLAWSASEGFRTVRRAETLDDILATSLL